MITIQHTIDGLNEAALARFVERARRALELSGTVSVLVTGSQEMRRLNRRFRRMNKPTDVLSFPAMPGIVEKFAGDLAISVEIAARNADGLGHTVADEIKVLILHGMLHLAGYDHEHDGGDMNRKEQRLRKTLGLPIGLIERTGRSTRSRPRSSGRSTRVSR